MLEGIILGTIQGVTEWLPVSSEGILVLVKSNFFGEGESLREAIGLALFLHLGTFFAALLYFRRDVWILFKGLVNYRSAEKKTQRLLRFLVLATFLSGIIAFALLDVLLPVIERYAEASVQGVTVGIGILLLGTAFVQMRAARGAFMQHKGVQHLKDRDAVLLGVVQGIASLPGFSRSGLTVSALLLRKFQDISALRVSFLMSLPAVLGGNILLNAKDFALDTTVLWGLAFAFIFGLLTIHGMLLVAQKVNFAVFVFIFGLLTIAAAFL